MRNLHLLWVVLLVGAIAAAQQPSDPPASGGLTPKAGAVSENLYTNIFFGFNFKFPQDWTVSFVAYEGVCRPECILLDVRAPEYPKLPRTITVSAETGTATRSDHRPSAALVLEQTGAQKLSGVKEIDAAGRKLYRSDYRSKLLNADLYQAFVVMPANEYQVVFAFAAENRKQLDAVADELSKALTFSRAK